MRYETTSSLPISHIFTPYINICSTLFEQQEMTPPPRCNQHFFSNVTCRGIRNGFFPASLLPGARGPLRYRSQLATTWPVRSFAFLSSRIIRLIPIIFVVDAGLLLSSNRWRGITVSETESGAMMNV